MSEERWLAATTTLTLWDEGPHREWASDRKLWLWACACCRCIWDLLPDSRSRRAIEVGERFADGLATEDERSVALAAAEYASHQFCITSEDLECAHNWAARAVEWAIDEGLPSDPEELAFMLATAAKERARYRSGGGEDGSFATAAEAAADLAHANLLREVIGNPFRPESVNPMWRTDTVLALARGMYESRDFSAMPILADALQDAGCDSEGNLAHCRDASAPHVRGCWVVDLVLGKV